jgi:hypothetical protein
MNPNKCAFGVSAGEFLGFLVHEGGIEVGKKSMNAIDEVVPPKGFTLFSTAKDQERSEVCMG